MLKNFKLSALALSLGAASVTAIAPVVAMADDGDGTSMFNGKTKELKNGKTSNGTYKGSGTAKTTSGKDGSSTSNASNGQGDGGSTSLNKTQNGSGSSKSTSSSKSGSGNTENSGRGNRNGGRGQWRNRNRNANNSGSASGKTGQGTSTGTGTTSPKGSTANGNGGTYQTKKNKLTQTGPGDYGVTDVRSTSGKVIALGVVAASGTLGVLAYKQLKANKADSLRK